MVELLIADDVAKVDWAAIDNDNLLDAGWVILGAFNVLKGLFVTWVGNMCVPLVLECVGGGFQGGRVCVRGGSVVETWIWVCVLGWLSFGSIA